LFTENTKKTKKKILRENLNGKIFNLDINMFKVKCVRTLMVRHYRKFGNYHEKKLSKE